MYEVIVRLASNSATVSQTSYSQPVVGFAAGQYIGIGSPMIGYLIEGVIIQIGTGPNGPTRTFLYVSPATLPYP